MEELLMNIVATIIENEKLTDEQKVVYLKRLDALRYMYMPKDIKNRIISFINKSSHWPYMDVSTKDKSFNIHLLVEGAEINIEVGEEDSFRFQYSDIVENYEVKNKSGVIENAYCEKYTKNVKSYAPNKSNVDISIITEAPSSDIIYKKLIDGNKITELIAFLDTNEAAIRVMEDGISKYYYAPSAKQILDGENNNYYVEEIKEQHYQKIRKEYESHNGTRN